MAGYRGKSESPEVVPLFEREVTMPEKEMTEEEVIKIVRRALHQAKWEEYNRTMIKKDKLREQKLRGFLMAAGGIIAGLITFMLCGCLIKTVWAAMVGILPGIAWMTSNSLEEP